MKKYKYILQKVIQKAAILNISIIMKKMKKLSKKLSPWGFPGGPGAKSPRFHDSIPAQGTKIPHAMWCVHKRQNRLSPSLSPKDDRPRLFYGIIYSVSCENSSTI